MRSFDSNVRRIRALQKVRQPGEVLQYEIARKLGVDAAEVSRTLSDRSRMDDTTFLRYKAAILELRAEKKGGGNGS
jgi:transcriptional regulator with XRE-family HTH domain